MQAILAVLADPILPVFAILAIGFTFGKAGWTSEAEARSINRLVMTVFVPIVLFKLTSEAPLDSYHPAPVFAYFTAEATVLALGFLIARYLFRLPKAESFLVAFAAIFTNTVMYVLPLSLLLYGEVAALPVASVVTLDSTITFAVAIIVTQMLTQSGVNLLGTLRGIVLNPILISLTAGLSLNLAGFQAPPSVSTFLAFNGAAMPPLALFALGVVLSSIRFSIEPAVIFFSIVKMMLFPLVVYLTLSVLAAGDSGAPLYLFVSAGPAGAMAFTLALLYNVRPDVIGQVIVVTCVLTLGSLAFLA